MTKAGTLARVTSELRRAAHAPDLSGALSAAEAPWKLLAREGSAVWPKNAARKGAAWEWHTPMLDSVMRLHGQHQGFYPYNVFK